MNVYSTDLNKTKIQIKELLYMTTELFCRSRVYFRSQRWKKIYLWWTELRLAL